MGNPTIFVVEDHQLYRLLIATNLAAFFSGMVDGATYLSSATNLLTTHLTGTTVKGGINLVNGQADKEGWEMCIYILVFLSGSILSGILTRRGELKSLALLCYCFLGVGSVLAVCGAMMLQDWEAAKYPALFASGVQNSILTAITGFARTTHVTGTVTDIGLLVGQGLEPEHWSNPAHWAKCRALTCLLASFAAGGAASFLAFDEEFVGMGDAAMFVPAAGMVLLGVVGHQQLWHDAHSWKVMPVEEEPQEAGGSIRLEGPSLSERRSAASLSERRSAVSLSERRSAASLRAVSSASATVSTMMAELRRDIPTIDNMPDCEVAVHKVISTAMSVKRAVVKFKTLSDTSLNAKAIMSAPDLSREEVAQLFDLIMSDAAMVEKIKNLSPNILLHVQTGAWHLDDAVIPV